MVSPTSMSHWTMAKTATKKGLILPKTAPLRYVKNLMCTTKMHILLCINYLRAVNVYCYFWSIRILNVTLCSNYLSFLINIEF